MGGVKSALATDLTGCTYDKAPVPPGPRAAFNISARDFWAKEGWLPGWGALREWEEREIGRFYLQSAFRSPHVVVSAGTDWPAKGV